MVVDIDLMTQLLGVVVQPKVVGMSWLWPSMFPWLVAMWWFAFADMAGPDSITVMET